MKRNHSSIFLEHIAMQVFIWLRGRPVPDKINVLTVFSRRKMDCRHLLREWYIRHSILASPFGAVWWHEVFQCYRCAPCGDSH
jgi:hypothetical protein